MDNTSFRVISIVWFELNRKHPGWRRCSFAPGWRPRSSAEPQAGVCPGGTLAGRPAGSQPDQEGAGAPGSARSQEQLLAVECPASWRGNTTVVIIMLFI